MTSRSHLFAALGTLLLLLFVAQPVSAQTEQIEYYGLDALGSVRVIFDHNGNAIDRMDYGPFGENLRAAIKFPTEQFAQLARDSETGQDYAQARNYSASTGRFNRIDPIYASILDPQAWNRYAYARNSPLVLVDPTGLLWQCVEYPGVCIPDVVDLTRAGANSGNGGSTRMGDNSSAGRGQRGGRPSPTPGPTDTPAPNPPPNPPGPKNPDEGPNDCRVFSRALANIAASTAPSKIHAEGAKLLDLALSRHFDGAWKPDAEPTGFRPSLTRDGQNYQVYRHVAGAAGSVLMDGRGIGLVAGQMIRDINDYRNNWSSAGAEIRGNMAGVAVAGAMMMGSVTGNAAKAQQLITTILCAQ